MGILIAMHKPNYIAAFSERTHICPIFLCATNQFCSL
jgi:hypothetical protein